MQIETLPLWEGRDDVTLTTFLSAPDPFFAKPVPRPAVVVCAGGAYMRCPRHGNEGDPVAMAFAMDGYQAFVLEYSVGDAAPADKKAFPSQLLDLGKALLTIRAHAKEWSVDVDKISIIGFSAGAHLCGMLATTWHEPLLSETFGVDSACFKPLTAMLLYGVLDYEMQVDFQLKNPNPFIPRDDTNPVFGGKPMTPELLQKYSPTHHVSPMTPPVFLAAAQDDMAVTPAQTLKMAQRLAENGVPCELHMFELGGHGFALGRNMTEPFREDMARACAAWLPLAKTFLMHHVDPASLRKEQNPFAEMEARMKKGE